MSLARALESRNQVIFSVYELFIAIRHLRSRRRQTILSILGIGLAVMILMVSQASMVGFTEELYKKTVDNMPHVTVEPKSDEDYIYLYRSLAYDIREIEGVTGASPVLSGQATFAYKDTSRNVLMQGILVKEHNTVLHTEKDITEGSFRDLEVTHKSVILGDSLSEKLDVKVGDTLDATFPEAKPTTLKVVGIYDSGTPQDETLAYVPLSTAQHFFDNSNVANSILVRVEDPDYAQPIADEIDAVGYQASSWMETNPEILQMIMIEGLSNFIILGMIIVIASFSMVSTLFMVVMEKTKEIGMLMAMGVPRRSILTIFLLEGGIMGLIGPVVGVLAGIVVSLYLGSITMDIGEEAYGGVSTFPFVVRTKDAVMIVIFTFLLNLVAGIFPARRASRLDPVEAISSE
ncbi:MAG: lipoprotein-releasing system permease protein [Candidatus Argoarchaeum ethanivorans]|uniref:Lipoprotein-releasing system permease protein n=1 Tax=Candidatus Argoarchaeum ethanivorans TaxID=2608793 RepID=A0A8B3S225_9EURY|nr:MAG: lipoprotein-releasing system permease protein [Candidatus Argoarchaeum ethanivorans]